MDSLRILLLEDDETLRELLAGTLTDRGYQVEAVGRGDDAIESGRKAQFDLIIADVRMEGTDGLSALGQVKTQHPDIRSIVITGYSTEADSIRAIRLGVSDYLKKPFRTAEFVEAVERQAERCRLSRAVNQRELELLGTAVWALEQARPAESAAGQLAEQVARALGMAPGPALETRLITLAGEGRPASDLQKRIAAACRGDDEADPEILEAMQQVQAAETPAGGISVLSVARALEHSQAPESARSAYQGLVQSGSLRERMEALLGLARLGEPESARQAVAVAREVGPLASARAALEAALLLEGEEASQLAREASSRLERRPHGALADLIVARWEGRPPPVEALELLMEPEHLAARADLARWGLGWLLEQAELEPLLRMLARESPREFSTALRRGQLSAPARRNAARALGSSWGMWAEEGLRLLAEDPDPAVRQAASQPSGPPMLRLFSLGPFEVFHSDARLEDRQWKSPKVRLMPAFLAAQQGRPVSEDLLQEVFWPEELRGRRNLSATLSHLRNNLRPGGWQGELNYVVRASQGIQLNAELPRWHDYDEVERASAGAAELLRGGQEAAAARLCRQVIDLYRGPYLEGQYAEWVLLRRTRVERLVLAALETLMRQETDPVSQLELAERTLELDPYHQEACLQLVNAKLALKRPEEAVRRFEACRKVLQRDLGIEPSIELMRAYETARLSL